MQHDLHKTNTIMFYLFLYFKNLHVLSKEDKNQFWLKNFSTSKEDEIHFSLKKNSNLHLIKMQICVCIEKNSDLNLVKMQICFVLRKIIVHMQICWHSGKRLKQSHKKQSRFYKTTIYNSCYGYLKKKEI